MSHTYHQDTYDYVNTLGYISYAKDLYPLWVTGDDAVQSAGLLISTGQAPTGGSITINTQGSTTPGAVNIRQNGADRIIVAASGAIGLASAPSQGVFINSTGANGLVLNNTTIANYSPSVLNVYEQDSMTLNFTGPFTASIAAKIVRLGNVVTLTIAPSGNQTAASASPARAIGAIPARFLSTSNAYTTKTRVIDNGAEASGSIQVNGVGGDVYVFPLSQTFTNAAVCGWSWNITITYVLL